MVRSGYEKGKRQIILVVEYSSASTVEEGWISSVYLISAVHLLSDLLELKRGLACIRFPSLIYLLPNTACKSFY